MQVEHEVFYVVTAQRLYHPKLSVKLSCIAIEITNHKMSTARHYILRLFAAFAVRAFNPAEDETVSERARRRVRQAGPSYT